MKQPLGLDLEPDFAVIIKEVLLVQRAGHSSSKAGTVDIECLQTVKFLVDPAILVLMGIIAAQLKPKPRKANSNAKYSSDDGSRYPPGAFFFVHT